MAERISVRVELTLRNATGDTGQDCGGTADASPESARTSAVREALESRKDALRGLGMGDGDGKRTHNT